ncbi:uncharacterized protein PV07_04130 [Cladophialophora immunda]|uniref:Fe2OG dioxygenase domain-containing protein n=1 Tax=Cladophialophora immunda TaxID=569365 RepID=A0A0D2CRN1_9EURO|nr:uncharacterized protein PV07_04130 [Cladophialophora immunda]KIW32600.1 hypothetical protein PV07_04130 [Cladophialophora immunda]OQU98980.1 hypothetical protein CLAIMM_04688 [Cladophialophora immunda]
MADKTIPIIDVSNIDNDVRSVAAKITEACATWGFFFIKNHQIPHDLIQKMFDINEEFSALPLSERNKHPVNKDQVGFKGPGDDAHKDEKSAMWLGGLPGSLSGNPGLHPSLEKHLPAIDAYKKACAEMSLKLLRCFAIFLGLSEDFFASHHRYESSRNLIIMLHYPKFDAPPPKHSARISPHSDGSNSVTILFQSAVGLEVLSPTGEWVQAPAPGFDHALINIGDVLQFWSCNKLKSTLHRITQDQLPWDKERYSVAFFCQPEPDTKLNPIVGDVDVEQMAVEDGKMFRRGMTLTEYIEEEMKVIYGQDFYDKQVQSVPVMAATS